MIMNFDVAIIGSGLAGVYVALNLSSKFKVALFSEGGYKDTNSYLAQGGIAASVGRHDSSRAHYQDTMQCGHHTNNKSAVIQLTQDALTEIKRLEHFGVAFDRTASNDYHLGTEGAHRCARVLRVGDYTGKAVMDTLASRLDERPNVKRIEDARVLDFKGNADQGFYISFHQNGIRNLCANQIVFASGGLGRLFKTTSNHPMIMGSGLSLAIEKGLKTSNLHKMQYHPTIFYNVNEAQEGFLISEAVRGEGAYLRNESGKRFMLGVHERMELAPRDVVSRAIVSEIKSQKLPYVWLDVMHIGSAKMKSLFPVISAYCVSKGIDMDREWIPVAPGAHYCMGGIDTDLNGRTNMEGIYAVGECAYTGVHGENRLASNSLLEALVFARKTAEDLMRKTSKSQIANRFSERVLLKGLDVNANDQKELGLWLDQNFGVERSTEAMKIKLDSLETLLSQSFEFDLQDIETHLESNKWHQAVLLVKHLLLNTLEAKNESNCQ